jgi:ribosomal protein S12 methylthiotransferase accessory factor YcaO
VKLQHPILSNADLARIRNLNSEHFRAATLPMGFAADAAEPGAALERALEELASAALARCEGGHGSWS